MQQRAEALAEKIQALTPAQVQQIEGLIDSFQHEDRRQAAASLSEASFAAIWNHPENDVYDDL